MRYSTRTRYGLRFLINLAQREAGVFVQLADIARQEDISVKYLEQIVRALRPSGILRTARGARGGYSLAIEPQDVTLEQVFTLLEGSLAPIACLEQDICARQSECTARTLWTAMNRNMSDFLRSVTLKHLLERDAEGLLNAAQRA